MVTVFVLKDLVAMFAENHDRKGKFVSWLCARAVTGDSSE